MFDQFITLGGGKKGFQKGAREMPRATVAELPSKKKKNVRVACKKVVIECMVYGIIMHKKWKKLCFLFHIQYSI